MTTNRKLQFNKYMKGYFTVIPKTLVEALGWVKGTNLQFRIERGNLTIIPEVAESAKTATSGSHSLPLKEGAAND